MGAAKNRAARDVQNEPQNFRTKKGEFEWGGMIPDGDPGSLPPNRPRLLVNTRLCNGLVTPRGGQATIANLGSKVMGLFDFQMGTKRRLMIVSDGCPGISSSIGFSLSSSDVEQLPQVQPGVYYNASTLGCAVAVHGDDLYIAQDNVLRRYQSISAPYGSTELAISGNTQDIPVYTLEAPYTKIAGIGDYPFAGLLFFGADNGAGASAIKTWDGSTVRDDLGGIDAPTGFGRYRDLLIIGFQAATNAMKTRNVSGAYTNYVPGAGTATFKEGVSYKDVFYFTTGGEDLFKFDGATLTRIPIGTTGIDAGSVTYGIEVFNNILYFTYTTPANVAKIATFNGTVWTQAHKNLTTQFPACVAVRPIRAYRGSLIVGVLETSGLTQSCTLYTSPLTATTGTWVRTTPLAATGSINQLTVY